MVIAALAALAAVAGLLWPSGPGSPAETISVHGETVALFGHSLYRHDSLFFGAGFRGQDNATLFLAASALLLASWRAHGRAADWAVPVSPSRPTTVS